MDEERTISWDFICVGWVMILSIAHLLKPQNFAGGTKTHMYTTGSHPSLGNVEQLRAFICLTPTVYCRRIHLLPFWHCAFSWMIAGMIAETGNQYILRWSSRCRQLLLKLLNHIWLFISFFCRKESSSNHWTGWLHCHAKCLRFHQVLCQGQGDGNKSILFRTERCGTREARTASDGELEGFAIFPLYIFNKIFVW